MVASPVVTSASRQWKSTSPGSHLAALLLLLAAGCRGAGQPAVASLPRQAAGSRPSWQARKGKQAGVRKAAFFAPTSTFALLLHSSSQSPPPRPVRDTLTANATMAEQNKPISERIGDTMAAAGQKVSETVDAAKQKASQVGSRQSGSRAAQVALWPPPNRALAPVALPPRCRAARGLCKSESRSGCVTADSAAPSRPLARR